MFAGLSADAYVVGVHLAGPAQMSFDSEVSRVQRADLARLELSVNKVGADALLLTRVEGGLVDRRLRVSA